MVNFCPQCGSKLQPDFKFCPSCGGRLPEDSTEPLQAIYSQLHLKSVHQSVSCTEGSVEDSALSRPPLHSTRRKTLGSPATPTEAVRCTDKKSQRKGKKSNQVNEQEETTQTSSVTLQTPDKCLNLSLKRKASHEVNEEKTLQTSVMSPSPSKCKPKKRVSNVKPVQVGTEVCDQSSKKWKLVELLWQTELDLTYAVCQANQNSDSNECKYIMKLGAKEGQLFNEQSFHLRAAKPDAVEKWVKLHKMDFLGIPPCVGFGLHEAYRFLVFPSMGQTLQSILDERSGSLSEKAVLQVALQLLDSLEFIHEKEYTHADIHAGNIYIKSNGHTEVFLSGFGYAFRYCPGGNHVEYRPGSRTAHQGNIHFISLDSHKGAGPSRRSDLQSLGYCMLSWMTGTLPWSHMTNTNSAIAAEKQRFMSDIPGLVSCCYKKRKASSALMAYLSSVMNLQYPEKPDYSHLKAGLHESLQNMGGTLKEPLDLQIMSPACDVHTQSSTSLEKYPGTKSEGMHILERERELTEALRRVQQEEGRSIQLQRELLQQFREMDAERRALQNQKCEQEQEHARLRKEKEEIQKEKNELQKDKEQMQKEREEFQKEKEELEKQKQELDSWKNAQGQAQTSGFYNC